MPRFSKHFRLNAPQAELDFVDVSTDYDTKVYVDPYAIEIRDDVWSGQCSELIRTFFLEVLEALRAGDDLRAQNLMSHLHEPAETFLGVSRDEPQGRGVGSKQAQQLVNRIKKSKAFKTGVLSDLSEVALFVERIGRDKISWDRSLRVAAGPVSKASAGRSESHSESLTARQRPQPPARTSPRESPESPTPEPTRGTVK